MNSRPFFLDVTVNLFINTQAAREATRISPAAGDTRVNLLGHQSFARRRRQRDLIVRLRKNVGALASAHEKQSTLERLAHFYVGG